MATARSLRKKGVRGLLIVDGTGLMGHNADIPKWQKRMQHRIVSNAGMLAPRHNTPLRPLRPHPGPRLKDSFYASQEYRRTTGKGFFLYSGVGSMSPYAAYVDQGTKPYMAKILPPWNRNSPTLYEHTWRPTPTSAPIGPVPVKGQKAQYFMQRALEKAMLDGGMRSVGVPDSSIRNMMPTAARDFEMLGGTGATFADAAFIARLEEWRSWRQEAWTNERNKSYARERLTRYRKWARDERIRLAAQEAENREKENQRKTERDKVIQKAAQEEQAQKEVRSGIKASRQREAERALKANNTRMKEAALAYYEKIKQVYPAAQIKSTTLADGVELYQVWFTGPDGQVVRQRWAYGYNTN